MARRLLLVGAAAALALSAANCREVELAFTRDECFTDDDCAPGEVCRSEDRICDPETNCRFAGESGNAYCASLGSDLICCALGEPNLGCIPKSSCDEPTELCSDGLCNFGNRCCDGICLPEVEGACPCGPAGFNCASGEQCCPLMATKESDPIGYCAAQCDEVASEPIVALDQTTAGDALGATVTATFLYVKGEAPRRLVVTTGKQMRSIQVGEHSTLHLTDLGLELAIDSLKISNESNTVDFIYPNLLPLSLIPLDLVGTTPSRVLFHGGVQLRLFLIDDEGITEADDFDKVLSDIDDMEGQSNSVLSVAGNEATIIATTAESTYAVDTADLTITKIADVGGIATGSAGTTAVVIDENTFEAVLFVGYDANDPVTVPVSRATGEQLSAAPRPFVVGDCFFIPQADVYRDGDYVIVRTETAGQDPMGSHVAAGLDDACATSPSGGPGNRFLLTPDGARTVVACNGETSSEVVFVDTPLADLEAECEDLGLPDPELTGTGDIALVAHSHFELPPTNNELSTYLIARFLPETKSGCTKTTHGACTVFNCNSDPYPQPHTGDITFTGGPNPFTSAPGSDGGYFDFSSQPTNGTIYLSSGGGETLSVNSVGAAVPAVSTSVVVPGAAPTLLSPVTNNLRELHLPINEDVAVSFDSDTNMDVFWIMRQTPFAGASAGKWFEVRCRFDGGTGSGVVPKEAMAIFDTTDKDTGRMSASACNAVDVDAIEGETLWELTVRAGNHMPFTREGGAADLMEEVKFVLP